MVSHPDLFTPRQGILGFEIPSAPDLEDRLRRLRSARYVEYEVGNLVLRRLSWL